MSIVGKILAVLNLFGAIGLVYLAMLDYGQRQVWAYNYFRHELTLGGLPLTEADLDAENRPIVDKLEGDLPGDLFKTAGGKPPVRTQVQEVNRIKKELDDRLQVDAQNKPKYTHQLARILLPLADSYLERESLLACRAHLGSDQGVAALRKRSEEAFREAQKAGGSERVFRDAFRAQGGPPAEYFTSLLLAERTRDPKATPEAAFNAALEAQRAALDRRYAQLFSDALGTSAAASDTASSVAAQKGAIARLLFGLSLYLAEEEARAAAPQAAPAADAPAARLMVIESEPFKANIRRTYVVCGLRASLEAISERASIVRRLRTYVQQTSAQDREQFVFDHASLIEQLREHAAVSRAEQAKTAENKTRLEEYAEVVRLRAKEIEDLEADLKKSREQTTGEFKKLQDVSDNVLRLRLRLRDAIRDNEQGERRIRELEKKVRELEK